MPSMTKTQRLLEELNAVGETAANEAKLNHDV